MVSKTQSVSPLLEIQKTSLSSPPKVVFIAPSTRIFRNLKASIEGQISHPLESKGLLADAIPYFEHSGYVLLGPALGASGIFLGLTPFLEAGAKSVAFIGLAGSFQPTIDVANYISPIAVHARCPHSSILRVKTDELKRIALFPKACAIHLTQVVSTTNPYKTNNNSLSKWLQRGCSAVEMELYSLASLQQDYEFSLHAGLVVSDLLSANGTHQRQLNSKEVKSATENLVESYTTGLCN